MQWISVKNRLPKYSQYVIVNSSETIPIFMARRISTNVNGEEWMVFGSCRRIYSITHWMPLPEPPKDID